MKVGASRRRINLKITTQHLKRCSHPAGSTGNYCCRRGVRRNRNHRTSTPDDTRLLGCNFFDGISQHVHVVEPDAGNHRHNRLAEICGIKPAPEPSLDYSQINPVSGKMRESNGREDFKPGWPRLIPPGGESVQTFDGRHDQPKGSQQVGCGDWPATDHDAFFKPVDMRRQITTDPVTSGLNHPCQHGGGRSLSLGTGEMSSRKLPLRITAGLQQLTHPREGKAPGPTTRRGPFKIRSLIQPLKGPQPGQGPIAVRFVFGHSMVS